MPADLPLDFSAGGHRTAFADKNAIWLGLGTLLTMSVVFTTMNIVSNAANMRDGDKRHAQDLLPDYIDSEIVEPNPEFRQHEKRMHTVPVLYKVDTGQRGAPGPVRKTDSRKGAPVEHPIDDAFRRRLLRK